MPQLNLEKPLDYDKMKNMKFIVERAASMRSMDPGKLMKSMNIMVTSIHFAKCKLKHKCPLKACRTLDEEHKQKLIRSFSVNYQHYRKCTEKISLAPRTNMTCLCWVIRYLAIRRKEEKFPDQPLSLQFLAACCVPRDPSLVRNPIAGTIVVPMMFAAIAIQRKWRSFLKARGLYKVSLCRYYLKCMNGVNCKFAHGSHDLRPNFVRRKGCCGRKRRYQSHKNDGFSFNKLFCIAFT
mmetsp:Transcript_34103/g.40811  ORF Transcript_34103/g.40811 Transcript_34103/m.40811 type:complete len:237 (+) Transcript_34103:61-771(+)